MACSTLGWILLNSTTVLFDTTVFYFIFIISVTIHKDHIAITDECGYTKITKQISE